MARALSTTVLVALLLVVAGCASTAGPGAAGTPAVETQRATVVDVIDGDTLEVRFEDGRTDRIRLLGLDTPEVHAANDPGEFEGVPDSEAGADCLRAAGRNATDFMQGQVLDETVTLVFDPVAGRRGSYGRLLAYVRLDGRDVNRRLIVHGHARLYEGAFTRSVSYAEAESVAQAERRGLWRCREPAEAAVETGPLRLVEVHADAAGDDRENLNDEYLVLENTADRTLELTGWTVEDSAGHTFGFPDGFTLAPGDRVSLHTGDGSETPTALYWGADVAIWNNDGDTVSVRAANGTVVFERTYE